MQVGIRFETLKCCRIVQRLLTMKLRISFKKCGIEWLIE